MTEEMNDQEMMDEIETALQEQGNTYKKVYLQ